MRPFAKPDISRWALPLLLGLVAFAIYAPSLSSDFVYDARLNILLDPYPHDLANLPAVLSLKVLGQPVWLAPRPMQLLFIMVIGAIGGIDPFAYHLSSNLLHAVNVALLLVVLRRLAEAELLPENRPAPWLVTFACVAVTLIFAVHPLNAETVAEVSYSSALMVMFFTLTALLAAMAFAPGQGVRSWVLGTVCVISAFAAVASKESGIAVCLILFVYWFLYRREEPKAGWIALIGASLAVTVLFLIARFAMAAPGSPTPIYLAGSREQALLHQPRLWVFMMGKLAWPTSLSADYKPINVAGLPSWIIGVALPAVLALQAWLARKSRLGALGVAVYWLGLATVSNLVPLYRPLADRFYYQPLAGVSMQLLAALLLLSGRFRPAILPVTAALLAATVPFTYLTLARQAVFANSIALWTDTLRISPTSYTAADNLGYALYDAGNYPVALASFQRCLELGAYTQADPWLGASLTLQAMGRRDDAVKAIQRVIQLVPIIKNPAEVESQLMMDPKYEPALRQVLAEAHLGP